MHTTAPTALDTLGGTIGLITVFVGGLVLLVLGIMMIIGAVMPRRSSITSWPQPQEQTFHSFDQRASGSHSQAWLFSLISGAVVFFIIVGVYFGVKPEIRDLGKSMNMSNLTKKSQAPAPKVEAPKAEAPKAETPVEAPKSETPPADEKK
ncbi:MAG: hypothetical protein ABI867_07205 [Kofleriaceae bacterium]